MKYLTRRALLTLGLLFIFAVALAACQPGAADQVVQEEAQVDDIEEEPAATPTAEAAPAATSTPEEVSPTATAEAEVTAEGATLAVRSKEPLGEFIVDGEGMSLYLFEADEQGAMSSACSGECAGVWPPLLSEGEPQAGDPAVDASLISTFEREDGSRQVAYNGWPLYYYAPDEAPGDTLGHDIEGFGGAWYLVTPEGTQLEAEEEEEATEETMEDDIESDEEPIDDDY